MKKNLMKVLLAAVLVFGAVAICSGNTQAKAKKKTYTVKASTKPYKSKYVGKSTYNSKTKQYYMLRSYLEKLEKDGGGTLVLKKGTYKVCSTLYVPSNVTIKLKSGVNLKKTSSTGTKKLKATKYLFQMVSKKKSSKKSVKGYKASRNVSIIGSGSATINMGKVKEGIAISMAHNYNITIEKIKFKNRKGGSFVAVSGAKKVNITKCKFYGGDFVSGSNNYYDIRLEVANKSVDSFKFSWSNRDNTTNERIYIKDNYFSGSYRAVGTTKYAVPTIKKKETVLYQENIRITGNKFRNIQNTAIQGMVWKDAQISSNQFYRSVKTSKTPNGVAFAGGVEPVIKNNSFNYISVPISFTSAKNTGRGKDFKTVKSTVSTANVTFIENNTVKNADHYYVPFNNGTEERIAYFVDKSENNLVITAVSTPYREKYMNVSSYGSNTKDYFKFRAAMEQLEATGGGTLTVQAGTYNVSNAIHVPSNVTVKFQNGVVVNKIAAKYTTSLTTPKAIFVLVAPSLASTSKTVGGYNGTQNVVFEGSGNVMIDCSYQNPGMAVVMGHTKNVTIRGIHFKRQLGYHFIELNSSQGTVVENCTFVDFKAVVKAATGEDMDYKEAINIDGTDYNTNGFNYDWSTHDKTTCRDIIIRNNSFTNMGAAIGSHTYSATGQTQHYHENIKVYNNTITRTLHQAIRVLNWRNFEITNNTFSDIGFSETTELYGYSKAAILLRGVVNPTVKNNTVKNSSYVIAIQKRETAKPSSSNYAVTKSILSTQNWMDMLNNTAIDCDKTEVNLKEDKDDTATIWDATDNIPENYKDMEFTRVEHINR